PFGPSAPFGSAVRRAREGVRDFPPVPGRSRATGGTTTIPWTARDSPPGAPRQLRSMSRPERPRPDLHGRWASGGALMVRVGPGEDLFQAERRLVADLQVAALRCQHAVQGQAARQAPPAALERIDDRIPGLAGRARDRAGIPAGPLPGLLVKRVRPAHDLLDRQ